MTVRGHFSRKAPRPRARLAIVVTHPIQYFAPVFRELASAGDTEVLVVFGSAHGSVPGTDPDFNTSFAWDTAPAAGYPHRFLTTGNIDRMRGLSGAMLAVKAWFSIWRYRPDAVLIFSYRPAFITLATILLRLSQHKLLLRAETTDAAVDRSPLRALIRGALLRFYYRQFAFVFPIGSNSSDHYSKFGVGKEHQITAWYSIDVDYFARQAETMGPNRNALRAAHGIPLDAPVLMYCGKMFSPKDPLIIPRAIAALSQAERERVWLLAVGDGELRAEFKELTNDIIGARGLFVGFQNQSELGKYYVMADTLILPSKSGETWGLVVNEALQFGLRVIVSDKVGCARDLVARGEAGWSFRAGDANDLAGKISLALGKVKAGEAERPPLPHPAEFVSAIGAAMAALGRRA